MKSIDTGKLREALHLLHEQLELHDRPKVELVVCGGSALIAMGLVPRTTRDIDIVALMRDGCLVDSEPLPGFLLEAAAQVGKMLNLSPDWLNNGPAIQFRMGFPVGFETRLHKEVVGPRLTIHYIDRIDQIHFKVFASVDRGGYHISDLKALLPTAEELCQAALWCMEQDVSEGFRILMREMFNQNGWKDVGERI